jgi:hypothetical protein
MVGISTSVAVQRLSPPILQRALYDAPVSEPHIRKVRPDDLEEVWRVHIASSNDLMERDLPTPGSPTIATT